MAGATTVDSSEGARTLSKSSPPYPKATASFTAVSAEQFAFFGSCLRTRFALIFLCAVATVPGIPIVLGKGGFPLSREYAAFVLGTICFAVPAVIWQHTKWRKGNAYFLTLPADRRLHRAARALTGWPALVALGCALLLTALAGGNPDQVPPYGWLAPLVGATVGYLLFTSLDTGSRWLNLLWVPLIAQGLGPTAEDAITPILEFVLVLFLGSDINGSLVGVGSWLLTSGVALAAGGVAFFLAASRRQEV